MTQLGRGGRVVIPAAYRQALGPKPGDDLILVLEDDEVRVMTPARAVQRAQALVRSHIPVGSRLSEELIQERREETAGG